VFCPLLKRHGGESRHGGVWIGGAAWRRGRPNGGRTQAWRHRVERLAGGVWIGQAGAYDTWAPAQCRWV
jgi:hypothetical protein